ncbi:Gldg family protein [Coleofasciculus chthonoplastes]|uniref:Gldg family protein n=1 Tax=Coleofasciculus chthonoplastes TaxID=64178 RepID=UPI0040634D00
MTTKPIKWTHLKYLFWFGPILTIMGITAQEVAGEWSPISLALLIAGLLIIGLWFLLLDQIAPGFWGRRSTQVGTNAIIATLAMFVIIGLINFLGVRYGVQIDLTENQLFTLSPQSQQVVRNLDQSVKVWVFESPANPADQELLENYRRYGSNLEFEFVDPQLQPEFAQKFNVNYIGEVYLEYGNQRELVQTISQGERLSEVQLTNAIERITGDRTDKVYFLQGHGERLLEASDEAGLSQAVSALETKNFTVEPLNLAEQTAVPDDASLIVIAGPKRALFEPEVQALEDYLAQGGSLLVMIDPDTNPGLEPLLSDWGVTLTNQIVIDASGQGRLVGLGPATPLVTQYGDHPITQDFGTGFSIYPLAQPVDMEPVEGIQETPLVITNPQSWAENTPEQQPLEFNEQEGDRPGPLVLGVALSRQAESSTASPTLEPETTETPDAEGEDTDEPEATETPDAEGEDTDELETTETPDAEGEDTDEPETTETPDAEGEDTDEPETTETPDAEGEDTDEPEATETPEASPSPIQTDKSQAKEDDAESRLIVYGNSNFATDSWFDQQLNPDIFINSVSWLSKRDAQALSISPKEPEDRRINLTPVQSGILGWLALLIVPAFGFLTAGMLWWLRR